ncbi:MAG: tetratricopeptide repeat protein [Patescibacteria group bacterium]|nr:tetratricopeptide repeat protein [Patescibacteria group bacterium]
MIQILLIIVLAVILIILFRKFTNLGSATESQSLAVTSPIKEKVQAVQEEREKKLKNKLELEKALEKVRSLKRKGEKDKAEKVLLKLLTLFNQRPEIFYELGLLYLEEHKYENAIAALNAAAKRESANGFYFHALGLAYLRSKDYIKAVENLDKALHYNNKIGYRWADLSLALIGLEKFAEAKDAITQALEAEPHNVRYRSILESLEKKIN